MSKEGLQAVVNGSDAAGGGWSSEMLRDLFTLRQDTASDTYDSRCRPADESINDEEEAGPMDPPDYKQQVSLCYPTTAACCTVSQTLNDGPMQCKDMPALPAAPSVAFLSDLLSMLHTNAQSGCRF